MALGRDRADLLALLSDVRYWTKAAMVDISAMISLDRCRWSF